MEGMRVLHFYCACLACSLGPCITPAPAHPALCYGRLAVLQFAVGMGELGEVGRWRKDAL